MSGTPATLFGNFMESTGPLYITTPDGVINDAQVNKTYSIGALMGGDRGYKKMIDGGSEIRFATIFETGNRTRFHQPGAVQNWAQPQKLVHGRAAWRFLITDMSWNLETVELNTGTGDMFQQFVDMKRNYEQVMWTDKWDFLENHIWSEPDFTEMESLAGGELGKFYSVAAFINEYASGLFNSAGSAGTPWTTVHGIDPTSAVKGQNRYVPNTAVYSNMGSNASISASAFSSSIAGAFEKMWQKVHFEKPPTMGEYYSDPAYNNQQIFTSPEGQRAFTSFLRNNQDLFVIEGRQDPAYPDPAYNFIPVKYVNALTTATLYPNNTTLNSASDNIAENTNATGNREGPRFYWINSNYLYPCFHSTYFFLRGKVREHYNDPDTFVIPVRTWGNLKCTSRQRQGLISPSGTQYANLYT
jgi:hypothetical protein